MPTGLNDHIFALFNPPLILVVQLFLRVGGDIFSNIYIASIKSVNLSLTTPRFPGKFTPKVLFGSLPRQTGENQEKKGGTILSNRTVLDFSCFWIFSRREGSSF